MHMLLYLLTALLAVLTVLPLLKTRVWWVRIWEFPRLQLALALLLLLAADALWLDFPSPAAWLALAPALLCLAYQVWWIFPYTRLCRCEVRRAGPRARGPRLRIITSNVLTPNRNSQALLDLVRRHNPDVLVTVESDNWWQAQLQPLNADYPYRMACPLDNLYGMHVYSKLPLQRRQTLFLVEPKVPSMHAEILLPTPHESRPHVPVHMHFLHPAPPGPTENEESTERDIELLMVARTVAQEKGPVVVAGDLNDVAWSPTTRLFRRISGLLDPRVGRGMINSFHARYWFARWPLDHFFHSSHFRLERLCRLQSIGSDHFPVMIELRYEPSEQPDRHGRTAGSE